VAVVPAQGDKIMVNTPTGHCCVFMVKIPVADLLLTKTCDLPDNLAHE